MAHNASASKTAMSLVKLLSDKVFALEQTGVALQCRLYHHSSRIRTKDDLPSCLVDPSLEKVRKKVVKSFAELATMKKSKTIESMASISSTVMDSLKSVFEVINDVVKFHENALSTLSLLSKNVLGSALATKTYIVSSILRLVVLMAKLMIQLEQLQFKREIIGLYAAAAQLQNTLTPTLPHIIGIIIKMDFGGLRVTMEGLKGNQEVQRSVSDYLTEHDQGYRQLISFAKEGTAEDIDLFVENKNSIIPMREFHEWALYSSLVFPGIIFDESNSASSAILAAIEESYLLTVFRDQTISYYDELMQNNKYLINNKIVDTVTINKTMKLITMVVANSVRGLFDVRNYCTVLSSFTKMLRTDPGIIGPKMITILQMLSISKHMIESYFTLYPCGNKLTMVPKPAKMVYDPNALHQIEIVELMAMHLDLVALVEKFEHVVVSYYGEYLAEDTAELRSLYEQLEAGQFLEEFLELLSGTRDSLVFSEIVSMSRQFILDLCERKHIEDHMKEHLCQVLMSITTHASLHWDVYGKLIRSGSLGNLLFRDEEISRTLQHILDSKQRSMKYAIATVRILKDTNHIKDPYTPEEHKLIDGIAFEEFSVRTRNLLRALPGLMHTYFEAYYLSCEDSLLQISKTERAKRENLKNDMYNAHTHLAWLCTSLQDRHGMDALVIGTQTLDLANMVSLAIAKWLKDRISVAACAGPLATDLIYQPSVCTRYIEAARHTCTLVGDLVFIDHAPILRQALVQAASGSQPKFIVPVDSVPKAGLLAASIARCQPRQEQVQLGRLPFFVEHIGAWLVHFCENILSSRYEMSALIPTCHAGSQDSTPRQFQRYHGARMNLCTSSTQEGIIVPGPPEMKSTSSQIGIHGLVAPGIVFSKKIGRYVRVDEAERKVKLGSRMVEHVILDPDLYLSSHQLQNIVEHAGPNGLQVLERYLYGTIAQYVSNIQQWLQQHANVLMKVRQALNTYEDSYGSSFAEKKTSSSSTLLQECAEIHGVAEVVADLVVIGHLFTVHQMLMDTEYNALRSVDRELRYCCQILQGTETCDRFAHSIGNTNSKKNLNLRQVLVPIVANSDHAQLWKLLPTAIAVAVTAPALRQSKYLVELDAHANNVHLIPQAVCTLMESMIAIMSKLEGTKCDLDQELRAILSEMLHFSSVAVCEMRHSVSGALRDVSFTGLYQFINRISDLTALQARDVSRVHLPNTQIRSGQRTMTATY